MEKRCISWIAVSSLPQTEKESPEEQRAGNAAVIAAIGGRLMAELEVPGQSRDIISFERACELLDAYAALRDLIAARGADVLVCRDLSRLGRTQALIAQVVAYCQAAGIAIYPRNAPPSTLDAKEQTASDSNVLLTAINASFAEIEINTLKRRWQYGMRGRALRGDFLIRPVYGYYAVRDGRGKLLGWAVNDLQAAVVRYALIDLYLQRGLTRGRVAAELNLAAYRPPQKERWTASAFDVLVRHVEKYAGQMSARLQSGVVSARGRWPAILTDAEAAAIRAEQTRRAGGRRSWRNYLFSQVILCGQCGRLATGNTGAYGERRYYRCKYCRQNLTETAFIAELERAVHFVCDHSNHADILGMRPGETARLDAESAAVERQRESLERRRKRLTRAYALEEIEEHEYRALMAETVVERALLAERTRSLTQARLETLDQSRRGARLDEIAADGARMLSIIQGENLSADETRRINTWIRRFLRFTLAGNRITQVEFL